VQTLARKLNRRASIYLLTATLGLGVGAWWQLRPQATDFWLLPMMDLDNCLLPRTDTVPAAPAHWQTGCQGSNGSAAHLVESTLQGLRPVSPPNNNGRLGYTLKVPLLAFLKPQGQGWQVDQQALERVVRTVRDNPRPLLLYLFSTHFGVNAPIEPVLAQNPDNLGHTPAGPLAQDVYYGQPVYPWSVARTDNPLTLYRSQVIDALLQRLCTLPDDARHRIKGISLLGETHQLFPDFESGMGFDRPYHVTDYSGTSVTGFRRYLTQRYTRIETLNQKLGSNYPSFDSVFPPAKNIRSEKLTRFEEHLDAYATGQLPVSGWVHTPGTLIAGQTVNIYLNGKPVAEAPVQLGRQDVLAVHPEFKTADVGWRHDLDFSQLPAGIHRIDLALAQPAGPLTHLGTRLISVMDKRQTTPQVQPMTALPPMQPRPSQMSAYIDEPREHASYYFNPLAVEWLAFREAQVVDYLQHFNRLVTQTCFNDTPRYTHQIVPQFNPSWDSSKYAAAASLQPLGTLRTGISLYGQTSYGRSLDDWFKPRPHASYGVTEFHPLQAMDAEQLRAVISQHQHRGARFVSFFLETRWQAQRIMTTPNLFSFDPDNLQFGSNQLYSSMQTLLSTP